METLRHQLESRAAGLLGRTGATPAAVGPQAVSDSNLVSRTHLGRTPSLETTD